MGSFEKIKKIFNSIFNIKWLKQYFDMMDAEIKMAVGKTRLEKIQKI